MELYGTMKIVDSCSAAEHQPNDILEQTTVLKDGRYHVGMFLVNEDPELFNNYFSAVAQFNSLERRLGKDPVLNAKYAKTHQWRPHEGLRY